MAGEPARHLPRTAAQVSDRRILVRLLDEAGEQGTVKRLVAEFVAEAGYILLSDSVIAAPDCVVIPGAFHDVQRCTPSHLLSGTALPGPAARPGSPGL